MTYTLHHGDALDVLRGMEAGSVDAVVTDPPYGIDYQSNRSKAGPRFKRISGDARPFVWWLAEAARVLKDGAPLLCFCRWDVAEAFRLAIGWSGLRVISQIVWDREHGGMGDLTGAPAPCHDTIWLAARGRYLLPGGRPESVVRHKRLGGHELKHPTEKPVDLMRSLVASYCHPGGTVLDPFTGSGSTGVAALAEGMHFIGVEREAEYCAIARSRLDAASNAPQQVAMAL